MPSRRTLSLKREVLAELTAADLAHVAGAAPPETTKVIETAYSCLAFISCAIPFCLLRDTDRICVE
jgi:hypothetical protein